VIDATRRIARWNVKYDTERIKATLDEMRSTMLQNVIAVIPMIAAMVLQVKQVCGNAAKRRGDIASHAHSFLHPESQSLLSLHLAMMSWRTHPRIPI
jgi:hypothetical protein